MKDNQASPRWPLRLTCVATGGAIAGLGLAAIHKGYWWIMFPETRTGTPGYAPSLFLVLFGSILLVVGLIPWPKSRKPKTRR